ncbi:MAG TPA: cupin domain-containing protein [Gaiellaceae bacterium]|jgi:quercetin dioxygenase-like cupin family protein|nr:cupin domain-containing protein [Gaiellaceae bacterium]
MPGFPWLTAWAADTPPPVLEFAYVPAASWGSAGGIRGHLEFRDSGLAEATDGLIGCQYVRYVGSGDTEQEDHGWHVHDLDWQFSILLAGSMLRATDEFGTLAVSAGDATCYPGFCWHREWAFSPDWQMLALRVPAVTKTTTGRETPLPNRAATLDPARAPTYSLDRPEAYEPGVGDEEGFEVRDLGAAGPSEGRIAMRIVRSTHDGAGNGPHRHSGSTWFAVLHGTARLEVDGEPAMELARLDAVSLGPGLRHSLTAASRDFRILEMTIPAGYETTRLDRQEAVLAARKESS